MNTNIISHVTMSFVNILLDYLAFPLFIFIGLGIVFEKINGSNYAGQRVNVALFITGIVIIAGIILCYLYNIGSTERYDDLLDSYYVFYFVVATFASCS